MYLTTKINKLPIILLTGPTSSGKSSFALEIAEKFNGAIINADSMQIYKEIPILSAQPTEKDQKRVPHHLYSIVSGTEYFSAGVWLWRALDIIKNVQKLGQIPILVGGTGLYFKSLIFGLSRVPAIPDTIRSEVRDNFQYLGKEKFYKILKNADPKIVGRILPTDSQRMVRAMEVIQHTKKSIIDWNSELRTPYFNQEDFIYLYMDIDREELHRRCNDRFLMMIEDGGVDEVSYLYENISDYSLPIMKGLGIADLLKYFKGQIPLDAAIINSQLLTRQYTKRQRTWFKHQLQPLEKINFVDDNDKRDIFKIIDSRI